MKKLNSWFKTTKLYWLIVEFVKMFSNEKSFLSKKRIESFVAFVVAQSGMIWFLLAHISKMEISDIAFWASIEFLIAGYTVSQIQKEKTNETK